jgi:hypothetical protein
MDFMQYIGRHMLPEKQTNFQPLPEILWSFKLNSVDNILKAYSEIQLTLIAKIFLVKPAVDFKNVFLFMLSNRAKDNKWA